MTGKGFLYVRDSLIFLTGIALMGQQILSGHPDPVLLEIGSSISGLPGVIHGLKLSSSRRTGTTPTESEQQSLPEYSSSPEPSPPSGITSTES